MAKKVYIGESNLSKKIDEIYLGINGKARKVTKAYIGINGAARQFWPDVVLYYWNKYTSKYTNSYYWNRYSLTTSYTYIWNRYNLNSITYYKWKRYNIQTNTSGYKWNKYRVSYPGTATLTTTRSDRVDRVILGNGTGRAVTFKHYLFKEPTSITIDYMLGSIVLVNNTGLGSSLSIDNNAIRIEDEGENATLAFDEFYNVGPDQIRYQMDSIYPKYLGYVIYENNYGRVTYGEVQYTKSLIGTVSSSSEDAYPENGLHTDGYWYESLGYDEDYSQGSYIDDVESTNSSAYPQSGVSGNYWYEYDSSRVVYSQGTLNGSVSSTSRYEYPDNGQSGSYWYVYNREEVEYSKGSYIGQVSATSPSQYPNDGYSGSYWYVYDHMDTTWYQGSYIGIVQSEDPSAYPTNGRHTDGYWYVKQ